MTPYYFRDGIVIYNADCRDVLPTLGDSSIDLIVTDPPYFKVKGEDWDWQWDKPEQFLTWMGSLCEEWQRVLKPNGSLYVFASPQMAWGVEGEVRKRFNVLQRITWVKPDPSCAINNGAGGGGRMCKESQREFWTRTECVIFAEQYGSDETAADGAGYVTACESTKRGIIGDYLKTEFDRAGVTNRQIAALFPSKTGGLTGCVSNWLMGANFPTPEQYDAMRSYLNSLNGERYLRREYEDLRREYEDLRREYEDLRREYEDLRRPFNVTADVPYTDVWDFPTVGAYDGKHPCEKPLAMMEHIIAASSKPGALVLDCFAGSGVVGEAARNFGRRAVLCEIDAGWCETIKDKMRQKQLF